MSEEKDDKKSIKDRFLNWVLQSTWFQIKNQIAEEMKLQGSENVKVENLNLNVNINVGDTNVNVPTSFPPGTNIKSISDILDLIAPKSSPQLKVANLDELVNENSIFATLDAAVNSSAAILSTIADLNG